MPTSIVEFFEKFLQLGIITNQLYRCAPNNQVHLLPPALQQSIGRIHENHVLSSDGIIVHPQNMQSFFFFFFSPSDTTVDVRKLGRPYTPARLQLTGKMYN